MPGRLLREEDSGPRSHETMEHLGRTRPLTPSKLANGIPAPGLRKDASSTKLQHGESEATRAQGNAVIPAGMQEKLEQLPPEILHIAEGYAPLDRLFQREAQESYNSLLDMLSDLRNMDPASSKQTNGNASSQPPHTSVSIDKRLRWLETAHNSRQRLMKLSVLLQWAQSSRQPVGRLVDLVGWMRGKVDADLEATDGLGWIKKDASDLQLLQPDIPNASRLLSGDGTDGTTIDSAYLPEISLTAKEIQQSFDRINAALQIRLNLHEDLPRHLQDFTIHTGRVTFRCPGSFEMDLSILDEDPSSNFFFIDLRFLFNPSTEIPAGEMRFYVDTGTNHFLQSQGLIKCYDFILDFVLSYKLMVLTRQAQALARSTWNGSLQVELIHRSLILRYWAGMAARQSWIEIGIQSASKADAGPLGEPKPSLAVKWKPYGIARPVQDELDLDDTDLDVEDILNQTVSLHAHLLLETTHRKLREPVPPARMLNTRFVEEADGDKCALIVPLYSTPQAELRIEPTSGSFAIAPVDLTNQETARIFSSTKQPLDELHQRIRLWRTQDAKVILRQKAHLYGWETIDHRNLDADTKRRNFGDANATIVFLRRWQSSRWVVAAFPQDDAGFQFALVEMRDADQQRRLVDGFRITKSQFLTQATTLSPMVFKKLQDSTIARISKIAMAERLRQLDIAFEPIEGPKGTTPVLTLQLPAATVHQDFSSTLALSVASHSAMKRQERDSSYDTDWTLSCVAKVTPSLATILSEVQTSALNIGAKGEISFLDEAPLGSVTSVDRILSRFHQLCSLYSYLTAIADAECRLKMTSLDTLCFVYAMKGTTPLTATLDFRPSISPVLLLDPPSNPHQRLLKWLNGLLQSSKIVGQSHLAPPIASRLPMALRSTLPLMQGFDQIEQTGQPRCQIEVLDLQGYRLSYDRPRCKLIIAYQEPQGDSWYCIKDESQLLVNKHLRQALDGFYRKPMEDAIPLGRSGMAVRVRAIRDALMQLDQAIRSCAQYDPPAQTSAQDMPASKPQPQPAHHDTAAPLAQDQPSRPQSSRQNPQHIVPPSSQPMQHSRSQGQMPPQTQHLRPGSHPMQHSRSSGPAVPNSQNQAMPNGQMRQQFQGQPAQMQQLQGVMAGAAGRRTPNGQGATHQLPQPNQQQQQRLPQNRMQASNGHQGQPQGQGQRQFQFQGPPQMQPYAQQLQGMQAQNQGQKRAQQDNAPQEGQKKKQKNVIEID